MRIWGRSNDLGRSRIGDDADVRHHAAVLMFADVAVVDVITYFGEGNGDVDRFYLAGSASPRGDGAIACAAAVGKRHLVHQDTSVAGGRAVGQNEELGLMHVEVVRFAGDVDELPDLRDGLVVGREREADVDVLGVECRDVFKRAGDGIALVV